MEQQRLIHLNGEQLFYLSTGRSNIYNFPNVWFPCKGVDSKSGKVEKYEWTIQQWMYELYRSATGKRRLDGVVKEFLKKFNSPLGIENMITSLKLNSWKLCVPYVMCDEPDQQLDAKELDEFAKDIAMIEAYIN